MFWFLVFIGAVAGIVCAIRDENKEKIRIAELQAQQKAELKPIFDAIDAHLAARLARLDELNV